MLLIAEGLARKGDETLALALTEEALLAVLKEPILIVFDEFQESFDYERPQPPHSFMAWIQEISTNKMLQGRVLFLSSRQVEEERWNERCEKRRLLGFSVEDGVTFLGAQLIASDLSSAALPLSRRDDVVKWLGGFPRALRLLVSSLHLTPLDDLIGVLPEAWQAREQPVSSELLKMMEREIVSRARKDLPPEIDRFFERLAVFRQPIDGHALMAVSEGVHLYPQWQQELQRRFLLELRHRHYSLHPVLRETVLMPLDQQTLKRHHALAGRHYARHFDGKRIDGPHVKLGTAFIEARYHFTQSGSRAELAIIAHYFEGYIKDKIGWTTPVPRNTDECSETIALLSALLDGGGATSLHYYLARLLWRRHQPGDLMRALEHAKRGTGPRSPYHAWLLRTDLFVRCNGRLGAWNDLRAHGLKTLLAEKNLFALYQRGAELLKDLNRREDAIALLHEGIAKIKQEYSLHALYLKAADLLIEDGKPDEALRLLEDGLARVGPESSNYLYSVVADLLMRQHRNEEAITLLLKGVAVIGDRKSNREVVDLALRHSFGSCDEAALGELQQILSNFPEYGFESTLAEAYRLLLLGAERAKEVVQRLATQVSRTRKMGPYQVAYCFLILGQAATAQKILDQHRVDAIPDLPNTVFWLACFIQLELQNQGKADELLARYLHRPLGNGEVADHARLMAIWDEQHGRGPALEFPVLFPTITGLQDKVARTRWQAAVLANVHVPSRVPVAIQSDWDARRVILSSRPNNWEGLYVIGCFDHRITVFTQQARALSLVRALFESGDLTAGQEVGIVGAGAAGITAAVAAARLGCSVTLYDERDLPLTMQAAANHRYLHPHIYDWPAGGSDQKEARLPILNWSADDAEKVINHLRSEFYRHEKQLGSLLKFKPRSSITQVRKETGLYRVRLLGNDAMINKPFNLVLLATGFGVENSSVPHVSLASYWSNDGLDGPFPGRQDILVSGAGDGGLVDVARAAIRSSPGSSHFRHHEAVQSLISDPAFHNMALQMAAVDDRARQALLLTNRHDSLYSSYADLEVPESLLERMRELKRDDTNVTFNYMNDSIFVLGSALLNRLLVFLLLSANVVRGKLGRISNVLASPAGSARKRVVFDDDVGTGRDFDIVVFRHGPPKREFEQRFQALASDCIELRGRVADLALTQKLCSDTLAWYSDKLINDR